MRAADTLALPMDATHTIRDAVARVENLRSQAQSTPELHVATMAIKRFQARRFAGTYADLIDSKEYGGATRFFLEELYSDQDYSLRDAQFGRIAGALQTFFPAQVVATAVSLAHLHVLTEELDHQMAAAWLQESSSRETDDVSRYMRAWKAVGRADDRQRQLEDVVSVGSELDRLTRTPGLRLMLKMMRRPAIATGLGSLQSFLESGFDTFHSMSGKGSHAKAFLQQIHNRESRWIALLFSPDIAACAGELRRCLPQAH